MVQKNKKKLVHSGNTLRSFNNRFNRIYRRQSCIVRHNASKLASLSLLDDLNISSNDVAYSLNKKGRWAVPLLLKEHILLDRHDEANGDSPLLLTERHKLKRRANCVGYFATNGPVRKCIPMNKTYFDSSSIESASQKRNYKDEHSDANEANDELHRPEVSVNIYYPCPKTSSITHNSKYLETTSTNEEYNFHQRHITPKTKKDKIKINRKHLTFSDYEDDIHDDYSEEEDEEIDYESSQYIFSHPLRKNKKRSFTAEDVLNQAFRMQSICNKSMKANTVKISQKEKKRQLYLLSEENVDLKQEDGSHDDSLSNDKCPTYWSLNQDVPEVRPMTVFLPRREITPEYLDFVYGNNYIECECVPRSFILDITDAVRDSVKHSSKVVHLWHKIDFASSLVFTYDTTSAFSEGDYDVYTVSLNAKLRIPQLKMKHIICEHETSLENIISSVSEYYNKLVPSEFYLLPKIPVNSRQTKFETLHESHGSEVENYHIHQRKFFRSLFDIPYEELNDNDHETVVSMPHFSSGDSILCHICYDTITDGPGDSFCLQKCGHWFCADCWRDHLIMTLENGFHKIMCPEYGCNKRVGSSFMMLLLNMTVVEKFVNRVHDKGVETQKLQRWCPNPSCGRVLKLSKDAKRFNVSCACGKTVCFDCLQPAHWPATCDESLEYWETIRKLGLDTDVNEFHCKVIPVRGKRCPNCNQFIEKQGGCFYMTCVCGISFCWGCRKKYDSTHVMTADCVQSKVGDNHHVKTVKVRHIQRASVMELNAVLQKAVRNRHGRMTTEYTKLKCGYRKAMKRCGEITRGSETKLRKLLHYHEVEGVQNPTTTEKIRNFLSTMMSLYIEMRYLAEYSFVFVHQIRDKQKVSSIKYVAENLDDLAGDIFNIFKMENEDFTGMIFDLWSIKLHCTNAVNGLVKIVNQ